MKPSQSKVNNSLPLLAIATLCLTAATPVTQAAEDSSGGVRSFLSDPQRVGSLTGTILGGALTAHPIGTLAGSIIGFFIGKETMHKDPEQQQPAQYSYAQRSFIPTTTKEAAIPMLALETSTPATMALPAPVTTLITSAPPATHVASATQNKSPSISVTAAPPAVAVSLLSPPTMNTDLRLIETVTMTMDYVPTANKLSPLEQIASLCYGNRGQIKTSNPDLQSLCYYHQSS